MVKLKPIKFGYLVESWNAEKTIEELPDCELKTVALRYCELAKIGTEGAMNVNGIRYRSNLQYVLENLDKDGLIDEIKTAVAEMEKKPPIKSVNKIQMLKRFQEIFKVKSADYYHPVMGFDVVKFDDEVVKSDTEHTGKSTEDVIRERWGDEAVDVVKALF